MRCSQLRLKKLDNASVGCLQQLPFILTGLLVHMLLQLHTWNGFLYNLFSVWQKALADAGWWSKSLAGEKSCNAAGLTDLYEQDRRRSSGLAWFHMPRGISTRPYPSRNTPAIRPVQKASRSCQ